MKEHYEQISIFGTQEQSQGPVECLGLTFESEEARRVYFLDILREKLRDPEFRQIEGFPIGEDEDILALSDPPYYTACPNPFIEDFIKCYGKPYDPMVPYNRKPFAADVSEGRNDPIYNAHTYHTKVPHKAIMRYILHYTEPGDVVFDGFCGTGMTGVAAQMCGNRKAVEELGYRIEADDTILDEYGNPFSKLGSRTAILNDLAPAATFIAYNYNASIDVAKFEYQANSILEQVKQKYGWMYITLHQQKPEQINKAISCLDEPDVIDKLQQAHISFGRINYTVFSDVFTCTNCGGEIVLWDAIVDIQKKLLRDEFLCPHCQATLTKRTMEHAWITKFDQSTHKIIKQVKQIPILISYSIGKKRFEKKADDFDLALIAKIEEETSHYWFPTNRMIEGDEARRNDNIGITHVNLFFTKRNLHILSVMNNYVKYLHLYFWINAPNRYLSKMSKLGTANFFHGGGGAVNAGLLGTLYVPSFSVENSVLETLSTRLPKLSNVFRMLSHQSQQSLVSTQSSSNFSLPDNSVDYIFLDPPFGANIMYSELNFLWEAWLKVFTNRKPEAIENKTQGKSLGDYHHLMTQCFYEAFRILKPGHWMTVEFSNTQASVWNAIQNSLQEAGFVIANVSALDKQQGSFKAVTTTTAVKQDLVISLYKPNGGLEDRFALEAETEAGVWDFVRTHMKYLPVFKFKNEEMEFIVERDPRILYDRMVAFYVQHGYLVPLSSLDFQTGLEQRFPKRDGMYFLSEQVAEYDKRRITTKEVQQLQLMVTDESSAIEWIRQQLTKKPQTIQDIRPDYLKELGGWLKHEKMLELAELLEQNFLRHESNDEVPSQIHSYLSSNYKELRNLEKTDPALQARAKGRWFIPDPNKASDLEKLREKGLLKEFEEYKAFQGRKLKLFRLEAVRAGFKKAWQERDYQTIIAVAHKIPDAILQEDTKLVMWFDQALTRTGTPS